MNTKKNFSAAAELISKRDYNSARERVIVAQVFAEFFEKENPRFDKERFFLACLPLSPSNNGSK